MSRVFICTFVCWCVVPVYAGAQVVLTLDETIARAREQSGAVVVARARIAEADAALLDATPRFRENPSLEFAAGPRTGAGSRTSEIEVGFSQPFETGGQRGARITLARAAVERQFTEVQRSARDAGFEAAFAFLDALAWMERVRLAQTAEVIARTSVNVAERRYALGDIAPLDVNLAKVAAAQVTAALASARAELTAAIGELRVLLRIPASQPVELRGSLNLGPPPPLGRLVESIDRRPEFAVLAIEVREAEAQAQLGRAMGKPDLGLRAAYEREEGKSIVLGGLTIALPAFQRGAGTLALGSARARRARTESEIARERAQTELRTAYAVYEQRLALADALEKGVEALLDDSETLVRRSYDAGEMKAIDVHTVQRDANDTRLAIIERRLDVARSRVTLDFLSGVIP